MAVRRVVACLLASVMISPAWGAGEPLGSISSSTNTTLRDSAATSGSTVFGEDVVSVAERGGAQIALKGGAQAEVLSNSSVRFTKTNNQVQMLVDHGQASFRANKNSGMTALVADATIRPASDAESAVVVQALSDTRMVVAAQKGALLITTARDGKVYTLAEGQAAELTAGPDSQTPSPAGKAAPALSISHKRVVIITVVAISAAAAVTAYLLARRETKLSATEIQNEISPHRL